MRLSTVPAIREEGTIDGTGILTKRKCIAEKHWLIKVVGLPTTVMLV